MSTSAPAWSIAIKTVGSRISENYNNNNNNNNNNNGVTTSSSTHSTTGESTSFTLQVQPDDPLHSLSTRIESITGLPHSEQRLIYRGRIITVPPPPPSSSANHNDHHHRSSLSKIQDIHGLSDGETIHLVPRIVSSTTTPATTTTRNNHHINNDNNSTISDDDGMYRLLGALSGINDDILTPSGSRGTTGGGSGSGTNVTSLSESEGMNLLAALLGLGSSGGPNSNNNSNQQQSQRQGGAGIGSSSSNGQQGGLGGIVSRAAMMGVLDDNGSSIGSSINPAVAAGRVPFTASLASGARTTTTTTGGSSGGGNVIGPIDVPTAGGLLSRSLDEVRASRTNISNPFTPNSNNNNAAASSSGASSSSSTAAIRAARNRRRATAARLTASDIRIPDPGSMEPVRQGLMTLHTLLGNAELSLNEQQQQQQRMMQDRQQEVDNREEKGDEDLSMTNDDDEYGQQQLHPLDSHRQWYRGQWLDALDTVNQWLEATIVDIVLPSDLLGSYALSRSAGGNGRRRRRMFHNNNNSQHRPVEAVVSGNDLEGRRRLLLEPRPPSDQGGDNCSSSSMGVYDLLNEGYRPRDDNDGVQLLLIHYNGWPHRWDEWIRSDSPRIRPFRTRTRHRIMSSHASPTPQAVFQAAPSTFIADESEEEVERAMLLPELQRVISSVNHLLSTALPQEEEEGEGRMRSSSAVDSSHLPWRLPNHGSDYFQSSAHNEDGDSDDRSDDVFYNASMTSSSMRQRSDPLSHLNATQLRQLAPLIDRLGRTLTDAAPHIASLADALPRSSPLPQARPVPQPNGSESFAAQASHLYFGINAEENDNDERSESPNSTVTADAQVVEVETIVDPDLTDFVNGMVNTTRGGSSRDANRDSTTSSLLASYLSSIGAGGALSGGDNTDAPRVVRVGGGDGALFGAGGGGGNGPGIDIHIHAIVTGPGMTPSGLGGLGIGGGGGGGSSTPVNRNNDRISAPLITPSDLRQPNDGGMDGDEADLFSDLYSESPPSVNLHQSQRNDDGNRDNLTQIFEECRSIEEESESSIDSAGSEPFDGKVVVSADEDAGPVVEGTTISAASDLVNESRDENNHDTMTQDVSTPDANAPSPSRRSFGSRMFRRTFGRLNGSSRRFSGS